MIVAVTFDCNLLSCFDRTSQAGVLSVMKLDGMEPSQLEALFVRWPATGITFPAFVALLRTQFGRVLGIECAALASRSCASLRTPTGQRLMGWISLSILLSAAAQVHLPR